MDEHLRGTLIEQGAADIGGVGQGDDAEDPAALAVQRHAEPLVEEDPLHLGAAALLGDVEADVRARDPPLADLEVHVLAGENGAGKTTSINMMCGLLKPDSGEVIAQSLQSKIRKELGLPCSLGIATNKLLAKTATDVGKAAARKGSPPNAITIVPPGEEANFLAPLPVQSLWGSVPRLPSACESLV